MARDLRFAGAVAAGLCAGVLGLGAIAAPLVGWNSWPDSLGASEDGPALTVNRPALTVGSRETRSHTGSAKAPIGVVGPVAAPGSVLITTAGGLLGTTPSPSSPSGRSSRPAGKGGSRQRLDSSSGSGTAKGVADGAPGFVKPADTDNDGMSDAYENSNGLNPTVNDSGVDTDNDGLTNGLEYQLRTAANNNDTNEDGVSDGQDDFDGDGVANSIEASQGSSPLDRGETPAPEGTTTEPATTPAPETDEPAVPVDSGEAAPVESPAPSDPSAPAEEPKAPVDPAPPADQGPAEDPAAPVEPADQSSGTDEKKKGPDQAPVASPDDDHHGTKPDPVGLDDHKDTQPVPTDPPDGHGQPAATSAPATTPPADPPVQATPPAPAPAPVAPAPAPAVQTAPPAAAAGNEQQAPPVQP